MHEPCQTRGSAIWPRENGGIRPTRSGHSALWRDVLLEDGLDADRRQIGLRPAGSGLDQPVDGVVRLDARVLVDDGIDGAGEQEAARVLRHLMADEDDLGRPASLLE